MSQRSPHLVVGFAEALAAPESIWSLCDAGFRVTAFTRRGARPPIRRFSPVELVEVDSPRDDWQACLGQIARLARDAAADALMPFDDDALWLLARYAACDDALPVIGATGAQAAFALDKRMQLRRAEEAGFAVPPTVELDSIDDLDAIESKLPFPLVIRRAVSVTEQEGRLQGAPTIICADRIELQRARHAYPTSQPLIVQPWLAGTGHGLFGLFADGKLVAASGHRRLRMVDPHGAGSSACISAPVEPELVAAATALLRSVEWRGLFMIELLRTADRTWFIEFNGRTWGSTALARRLGNEYPAWSATERLSGRVPAIEQPPFRELTCRHLGFEIAHVLAVLKGPRSRALSFPSRVRTLVDVSRIRRTDTWYNLRPGYRRIFVEDTLQTALAPVTRRLRRR